MVENNLKNREMSFFLPEVQLTCFKLKINYMVLQYPCAPTCNDTNQRSELYLGQYCSYEWWKNFH